jgi:hypothetical protein
VHHLAGSECLWNEDLLEHVQIHDTDNGLHEQVAIHFFFAEGAKHVHLWAVTNMFQGDIWISAPDPAVVVINLTTKMKCAHITENYKVQKSLALYPKHLHTAFLTNHLICIPKVLNDG